MVYVTAREALDEFWLTYRAILAIEPMTPGNGAPEYTGEMREITKEWDRRVQAFEEAFVAFKRAVES